nr:MAG TPA: hypothetical protein [Caudoviricetes sp.]
MGFEKRIFFQKYFPLIYIIKLMKRLYFHLMTSIPSNLMDL